MVEATTRRSEGPLTIRLFGAFDVDRNGEPLARTRTRKEQWLLALLALRPGQALDRRWLAGMLWPDTLEAGAMANLRRSLTDLRRVLGDDAARLHAPTSRTLRLDGDGANIDVREFDLAVARGDTASLERAVELYRGPLLEGCLEEWVLPERDVRAQAYVCALETLGTRAMDRGEAREAARHLRRGVSVDPLRESMQRALMEALAADGDAAAATQVYRDLRLLLHREMRVAPAPETTGVLERIRADSRRRASTPAVDTAPAAPPPRRIPQPVSSLIGRQLEVQEIRMQLGAGRLVTLTGAGGVGKTRLGIQVAEEVAEEYPDGVWFVELAALSDSYLVPWALASALAIREEPDRTLAETLLDALHPKTLLLILDNCEHLIEACARLIDVILSGCPQVRVLATSREALGLGGEVAWQVPSLSIPTGRSFSTAEKDTVVTLLEYDSVRLFVQRAALVRPDFRLTNENVPAVAEVCGSLDGMPLAIELAAARLKAMSVEQVASRLDDRFRLLTSGSRTALPRQQTLRATLDWGYELLTEEEKRALRWLSVFAGGWTLEAAEALLETGHVGPFETLDLLEHLVDKSLVNYVGQAACARYHLLETVRQYGRDRLLESGETETARRQHRDFFLQLAEDTEPQLLGNEQATLLTRLEVEHDNLRAALDYSRQAGHVESNLRMAGALWRFWHTRGYILEGRERLIDALAPEQADGPTGLRAKALNGLAGMVLSQGEYAWVQALLTESLAIRRSLGDEKGAAISLDNLGIVAHHLGELSLSRALHDEAATIQRRRGDRVTLAAALSNAGYTAFAQGDYAAARSYNEESLRLSRDLGNNRGTAIALDNLGDVAQAEGDFGEARSRHADALALVHELGDERLVAQCLEGLARTAASQGEATRAVRLFGFEERLRETIGSPLPPVERDEQARSIAAANSALNTASFEQAWTEGRAMTLERAITLALEGSDA